LVSIGVEDKVAIVGAGGFDAHAGQNAEFANLGLILSVFGVDELASLKKAGRIELIRALNRVG